MRETIRLADISEMSAVLEMAETGLACVHPHLPFDPSIAREPRDWSARVSASRIDGPAAWHTF